MCRDPTKNFISQPDAKQACKDSAFSLCQQLKSDKNITCMETVAHLEITLPKGAACLDRSFYV
jgi:hypothetical protein